MFAFMYTSTEVDTYRYRLGHRIVIAHLCLWIDFSTCGQCSWPSHSDVRHHSVTWLKKTYSCMFGVDKLGLG